MFSAPVITGLVFAAVLVLSYVVLALIFSEERRVTKALRQVSDWEQQQASEAEPLLKPFRHRVLSPAAATATRTVRAALPAGSIERLRHQLELAGNPRGLSAEGIVALRVVGAIVLSLVAAAIMLARADGILMTVAVVLGAGLVGWMAPGVWLAEVRQRRQSQIRRALPDMLDMLTISVQAGLGFDMALAKLVRNTTGPLAEEFARMLNEVQAGVSRKDGFRHLGERTDVPELSNFIMAMVQADVFGVSVSSLLRSQAGELRTRRRQAAEETAQKAPVKMVFPIVLCILPATILVIVGPAALAIGHAFGLL